ncbi:MAG: hypothetical protein HON04_00470 [Planctomicrobium sp.]|jgi:SRSO17 transposase|nr:hypothetical protein [Planctomicrobium sp.]
MSLQDIASLGKMLAQFLSLFADCFHGQKGRPLLTAYVRGLLSDIGRKNVEAIALMQGVAPRTLKRFLESIHWDHDEVLRRCRQLVVAEHSDPNAIGVIDETGTAKSGNHTVGVKRQYNGNRQDVLVKARSKTRLSASQLRLPPVRFSVCLPLRCTCPRNGP